MKLPCRHSILRKRACRLTAGKMRDSIVRSWIPVLASTVGADLLVEVLLG